MGLLHRADVAEEGAGVASVLFAVVPGVALRVSVAQHAASAGI